MCSYHMTSLLKKLKKFMHMKQEVSVGWSELQFGTKKLMITQPSIEEKVLLSWNTSSPTRNLKQRKNRLKKD
jgi:hypothetical protein